MDKTWYIAIPIVLFVSDVFAQVQQLKPCYLKAIQNGHDKVLAEDFEDGINKYRAAETCPADAYSERVLADTIADAFQRWVRYTQSAYNNLSIANTNLQISYRRADSLRTLAIRNLWEAYQNSLKSANSKIYADRQAHLAEAAKLSLFAETNQDAGLVSERLFLSFLAYDYLHQQQSDFRKEVFSTDAELKNAIQKTVTDSVANVLQKRLIDSLNRYAHEYDQTSMDTSSAIILTFGQKVRDSLNDTLTALQIDGRLQHLVKASDTDRIFLVSDNQSVYVSELNSRPPKFLEKRSKYVRSIATSSLGQFLFTASDDRLNIIQNFTEETTDSLSKHREVVLFGVFSSDDRFLLTGSRDDRGFIWNTKSRTLDTSTFSHSGNIYDGQFSPKNNGELFTRSSDGSVRIWKMDPKTLLGSIRHGPYIDIAQYSSDGNWIATASLEHFQLRHNSGKILESRHDDVINCISFHPTQNLFITGSDDGKAIIWKFDFKALTPLQALDHLSGKVIQVRFSPSGKEILTLTDQGVATLWDQKGNRLMILEDLDPQPFSAFFSTDGNYLYSISKNLLLFKCPIPSYAYEMIKNDKSKYFDPALIKRMVDEQDIRVLEKQTPIGSD